MAATEGTPRISREEAAQSLRRRAVELWGPKEAESLEEVIEAVASNIVRLSQNPPLPDEEPGFYFVE